MRWLLVSAQHHPSHGGIGAYVARFTAAAREAGWDVQLLTRRSSVSPRGAHVRELRTLDMSDDFASRLPRLRQIERARPYRYALWSRAVAHELLNMDIDFDAIEFVDSQAEGFVALSSRHVRERFQAAGVPMLMHAHTPMFVIETLNGADINRFGRRIYHQWEREALERADGVMAASRMLLDKLPAVRHSMVAPFPIGATSFFRDGLRRDRSELTLLIGSVQPCKGIEAWARSLNHVFRARPQATAMLIGPDTPTAPGQSSMAAHARRLIEPQFRERFQWTGALPHEQVLAWMQRAALVAVASSFESFSFVAAEALCLGTPVIASDRVGIVEHVPKLPTFPVGDVNALADAQIHLLSNLESAFGDVRRQHSDLIAACAPERYFQHRAEFVESVKSSLHDLLAPNAEDALDSIDAFIASIEMQERATSLVSSDVS